MNKSLKFIHKLYKLVSSYWNHQQLYTFHILLKNQLSFILRDQEDDYSGNLTYFNRYWQYPSSLWCFPAPPWGTSWSTTWWRPSPTCSGPEATSTPAEAGERPGLGVGSSGGDGGAPWASWPGQRGRRTLTRPKHSPCPWQSQGRRGLSSVSTATPLGLRMM